MPKIPLREVGSAGACDILIHSVIVTDHNNVQLSNFIRSVSDYKPSVVRRYTVHLLTNVLRSCTYPGYRARIQIYAIATSIARQVVARSYALVASLPLNLTSAPLSPTILTIRFSVKSA